MRLRLLMGAAALIACRANETPEPTTTRTSALTRTLATDTDTFINSAVPGNNNGASPSIYTGRNGQGGLMRGLIRFAMPPELQARATVIGVHLTLITRGTGFDETNPPTPATASLQALTTSWGEGSGFGDAMTMFTVGQPCVAPGATWDQPNCVGGTAWAGGAVAGAVSGTASVPAALEAVVTWDSASGGGMLTDVQRWIDDPTTNHGWRIVSSTEGGASAAAQKFYASEEVGGKGPSLVIDYDCKAGFAATGNLCTSCTAAAIAACAGGATGTGNVCVDPGAPATTYSCVCAIAGYISTGAACIDRNECSGNPCAAGGDSAATCVDHPAPATGYDCTCGAGFIFNGTSCVSPCGGGADPCGSGGTCTANGSGWTCNCATGYVSSGGARPSCQNLNACNGAAAAAACATTAAGNACVDLAPPSLAYMCACGNAAYTGPGAACVDKNECSPNPCDDGGDSGSTCVDHVAPATGYDCTCGAGFVASGGATPTCLRVAPPETSDAAVTDGGDAAAGSGGAAGAGGNGGGGAGGNGGGLGGATGGTGGGTGGRGGATGGGAGTMSGAGGRGGSNAIGAAGTTGSGSGSGCSCSVTAQGGEAGGAAGLFVLAGVMLRARSGRSRRYRDRRCADRAPGRSPGDEIARPFRRPGGVRH